MVVLPEPLGPMMAWVSLLLIVRLTPRRISFLPFSVSTLTCRSRISRVDIYITLFRSRQACRPERLGRFVFVDIDHDAAVHDAYGINRNWLRSRQGQSLTCLEVEGGAVEPALDRVVDDVTFGQGNLAMGTDIRHRVNVTVFGAHHCDFDL